jgi:hypothetical protein
MSRIKAVMLSAACLALLAGCTSSGPMPLPEPESSKWIPASPLRPEGATTDPPSLEVADERWAAVIAQFPAAQRPAVSFVRYVTPAEAPSVFVDCMNGLGFPDVTLLPDGGVNSGNIPDEQREASAIARFGCDTQYPVDPIYEAALTDQQLGLVHDYFVESLIPCLTAEGYSVGDVPGKETFVATYLQTGWSPYASVPQLSGNEWYTLNEICPQWPDGLWG